ncbi:MAG: hypothetical protein IKF65_01835, partial [Clostridia bacterium]|nr:hypothetical protein [Clostridia bacterium]
VRISRSVPYFLDSINDVIAVAKFAIAVFLLLFNLEQDPLHGISKRSAAIGARPKRFRIKAGLRSRYYCLHP